MTNTILKRTLSENLYSITIKVKSKIVTVYFHRCPNCGRDLFRRLSLDNR